MYKYSFEKLEIWKLAKELTMKIYEISKVYPNYEKYGISSQIQRAVISISTNIAEGSARESKKDQAHFLNIAFSSLMEVLSLLSVAEELKYHPKEITEELRNKIDHLANKINALRKLKIEDIKLLRK